MARRLISLVLVSALASIPSAAPAFVNVALDGDIAGAPRWSPTEPVGRGLADGKLAVAVASGFAEEIALAVTGATDPQDVADIESAVVAAFAEWQSPVLRFDVTFDGAVVEGELDGSEIDLFTVLATHPKFAGTGAFFGVTYDDWSFETDRTLTNGAVLAGNTINGADIYIAKDRLALAAGSFTREQQLRALQRLLTHEIGHAIGLHHPNDGATVNFDTDTNPNNAILVDPADPLAEIALSPSLDTLAVMNNLPSDLNALFYTSLRDDDRGGRDVLYPALEATQDVCQPSPVAGCRAPLKSTLQVRSNSSDDGRDQIVWKWLKGDATSAADFGAPDVSTRYSLCVYHGALPRLAAELALLSGASFSSLGEKGFRYTKIDALPRGVRRALLKAGEQDRARIVVKGGGPALPDGWLPLAAPIAVQLVRADTMGCWAAAFQGADVSATSDTELDARTP